LLAQKRGIKREFDEPDLCDRKKGHFAQKLLRIWPALGPLGKEANAPALPPTIEVNKALFVAPIGNRRQGNVQRTSLKKRAQGFLHSEGQAGLERESIGYGKM
jgi:hypothetical protein